MTQSHVYFQHRWLLTLLLSLGIWGETKLPAEAHGAHIQTRNTTVEIQAAYDSGEPMAEAQVQVYDPTNPQSPRFTGETDKAGQFSFTPDQPGDWEVTVRQAGHGATTAIPIDNNGTMAATFSGNSQLTPLQKSVIAGAIIWGCIGTALYFQRSKR
ncbi:MAG: carboxypeptidase-like regulatory domain-containing protein [Cyanobacteria bacterium J06659_2]